jgi:hypothetical protein
MRKKDLLREFERKTQMQSHQNRSRLSLILRSRFIPSFSSPLSLFVVLAAVPLPIYFSGLLSGRNNKPLSVMRLNSNLASSMVESNISCTTFNILAPIYKRVDQKVCFYSSDFFTLYLVDSGIDDIG